MFRARNKGFGLSGFHFGYWLAALYADSEIMWRLIREIEEMWWLIKGNVLASLEWFGGSLRRIVCSLGRCDGTLREYGNSLGKCAGT